MALRRKSRNVSRVLARFTIQRYTARRQGVNEYVVEHKGICAHRAAEPCELCKKGGTPGKGRSEIVHCNEP